MRDGDGDVGIKRELCVPAPRPAQGLHDGVSGRLYQIHETIRAPYVWVEEHVEGTRRITHQGRPLGVHALRTRPVKLAAVTPVPPPRRPVTPRPDYPWRTRWPTREPHAEPPSPIPDISTLGGRGHSELD
jgi:hypothetical protein